MPEFKHTPRTIIPSDLLYDFDNFMLDYPQCTQEDREIAIELFSVFINNSIECGTTHIVHDNNIHIGFLKLIIQTLLPSGLKF